MTVAATVLDAAFVLVNVNLGAFVVREHFAGHFDFAIGGDGCAFCGEQADEFDLRALLECEFFDANDVAFVDAVLLATCFDNCEHHCLR